MIGKLFFLLCITFVISQRRDTGVNCIACTIIVGVLIKPKLEKTNLIKVKNDLCNHQNFKEICHKMIDQVAPMIESNLGPDEICRFLK